VNFTIRNTGNRCGDEIAQLYIHDEVRSVTTYVLNLRGFDRVSLEPGQSKEVQMQLTAHDMSLLNRDMKRVVEPGWFKIMVGASSEDIRLTQRIQL
jgi:beta-glucosidase